jgi:hypothetical protein
MELKSMLLPEKTVTFDFPGCEGFNVDLSFLSKESNQTIYKKCQKTQIDPKTRQPLEKFDDDLFLQIYVKSIIKGWNGLKLKYLKELVLVEVPEEQEEDLLEFTEANALDLMKNSVIFDNWISDQISDLGNFTSSNSTKKSEE